MIKTKKIIVKILKKIREIKWYLQYLYLKKESLNSKRLIIKKGEKLLIIVPHADDELIGCYQLIKNFKDNVILLYCNFTGSNNEIENSKIRKLEFLRFCKKNNINYLFTDTEAKLVKEVMKNDMDYIFLPCFIDWHNEHRKISEIIRKINLNKIKIGMYQISVPLLLDLKNFYVSLDKFESKNKWNDFKESYPSQSNLPTLRFILNEKLNKKNKKIYANESFCILESCEWINKYDTFLEKIDGKKLENLKFKINNFIEIRKEIRKILILLK